MKRVERKIALRCAVYTRVSTNSGLEQDFNSLDNQREASEAYSFISVTQAFNTTTSMGRLTLNMLLGSGSE